MSGGGVEERLPSLLMKTGGRLIILYAEPTIIGIKIVSVLYTINLQSARHKN